MTMTDERSAPGQPPEPPASGVTESATRPARSSMIRRLLTHEWFLAAVGSIIAALGMTWPAMRHPMSTLPGDTWDTSLQAWQIAWSGWALKHDPSRLWQSNAHFGEQYAFAYSDSLLGYLPAGLIGNGPTAAILRYNILYILVFALAAFGAYVLARQLGSSRLGAAVAGAVFAYAPWRWTHVMHLNLLSTGGIALSLAMLARGHGFSLRHGYRPERARPAWALAGWLVAAWQVTLGFGIGLTFGYLLALLGVISLAYWLRRRPPFGRRLLIADIAGGMTFLAIAGAMAYPYMKVTELYPYAKRGLPEIMFYSAGWRGFFTAPSHEWLWGRSNLQARIDLIPQGGWEALMLPGFFVMGLAAIGLLVSAWPRRYRVLMLIGVLGTASLAMGLRSPLKTVYFQFYDYVPGWNAVRVPSRQVLWVLLFLSILAAGAVTALSERAGAWLRRTAPNRSRTLRPVLAAVLTVPLALVLLEGVQIAPVPRVPPAPASFDSLEAPVLVVPSNYMDDELTMLWSTNKFQPLVNGSSGFIPAKLIELRKTMLSFPDPTSVAYLRARGVKTVMALKNPWGKQWSPPPTVDMTDTPPGVFTTPVDKLGITREEQGDVIIFRL